MEMRRESKVPGLVRVFFCGTVLFGGIAAAVADPDQDYQRALEAYLSDDMISSAVDAQKAADAGHIKGMVLLADILDRAEEDAEALKWYRKAADGGSAEAALGLGKMLANGEGGKKDPDEARKWILKAVEQNFPDAMVVLANLHRKGEMGVQKSPEKALELLKRAAEAGHPPAIKEMIRVFEGGLLGQPKDPAQVKSWQQSLEKVSPKPAAPKKP
ncbi:MAG: sel1 repeat family protein [Magnetococcales bacterium]|nr:sel1 repeat family protein [Magnetococcales bacterium]MBF0156290.1 sel1 repeat family protein [Magnetococcales bacterium]